MDDHTQKSRKDGKLQYVGQCLFRNKFRKFSSTHLATLLVSWLAVIKIFKTQTFTVDLKNYESHECNNF